MMRTLFPVARKNVPKKKHFKRHFKAFMNVNFKSCRLGCLVFKCSFEKCEILCDVLLSKLLSGFIYENQFYLASPSPISLLRPIWIEKCAGRWDGGDAQSTSGGTWVGQSNGMCFVILI